MGLCRGGNLLLGMSIIPSSIPGVWGYAVIPVIYIAAVTIISRGEVRGSSRFYLVSALGLYVVVLVAITGTAIYREHLIPALPFIVLFASIVLYGLVRAIREPAPGMIGKAVKAGVLGLILLNASWVAASASLYWAIVTAILLPFSWLLAKPFAVT